MRKRLSQKNKDQLHEIVLIGTFNYPSVDSLDLLAEGARVSLEQKAGFVPQKSTFSKSKPILEELAVCNLELSKVLNYILKHKKRALLEEFLLLVHKKSMRVASDFVQPLAEISEDFPELKPLVIPALGKWGAYVAEQNQEWKLWKIDNPKNWEKGSTQDQLNYLQRHFKKSPEEALNLLKELILSSPKAKQYLFFSEIKNFYSVAHQEFVKSHFEDKKSNLRLIALQQLATRDDAEVLSKLEVIFKDIFQFKNSQISIHIPTNKSALWDLGFDKKSWIQDFCTCVPFEFWQNHFKITINQLVKSSSQSEYSKAIFLGVLQNAIQSKKENLIFEIFKYSYSDLSLYNWIDEQSRKEILKKLKLTELKEIINLIFSQVEIGDFYFLMAELVKYSRFWTETFAQQFLIYFEEKLTEPQTAVFLNKILLDLVHRLPLNLFRETNLRWQELAHRFPSLSWQLERALHEFRIRTEIYK